MGISTETDKANKKPDRPNIRMSFSPRHGRMSKSPASYRSDRQLNFDGFREDDDMITLESHSTTAAMSQSGTTISAIDPSEEKSYFIARMESMLEKVEESILESRPSDEIDLSRTSSASPNRTHLSQSQLLEETFDDDSTNVVATQIASENKHQESVGIDKETATQNIRQPRPSHILVNSAIASPAHTNITMDATMMNDTLMSMSALFDDDNLSTVTPILDRYRLDADDNSIGVKVVPNQRGTHSRQSKQVIETIPETPYVYSNGQDGFRSPVGLPGSVSARKKKYRKTPLPKKRVDDDDSFQTWDENDHPNIRVDFGSPHSAISHSKSSTSIFVPPLRPRSLEMRKTLPKTPLSTRAHHSLPGKISNPRTPLTDSYVAKHMTPSRSRISENLDQESMRAIPLSPTPSERSKTFGRESVSSKLDTSGHSFKTDSSRMGKWMEKITMAEYDRAPRVVQMQVNREETNKSLDALEDFLTSNLQESNQTGLEFSEKQGYQVLQKLLGTEQRCKSVLMSLCHWRRLLMYRDNTHGMVFAVNQFEQ